jgi:hypothetical protein
VPIHRPNTHFVRRRGVRVLRRRQACAGGSREYAGGLCVSPAFT